MPPSELEAGDIILPPPQRPEQPVQRAVAPFVQSAVNAAWNEIIAPPGRVMQQKQPQAGEMYSDEQEAIRQLNVGGELTWGAKTGLGMVGTPGVPGGALGSSLAARAAAKGAEALHAGDLPHLGAAKKAAPFPQYAEKYPEPGPPALRSDPKKAVKGTYDVPLAIGNVYHGKELTPEAKEFAKVRNKIDQDMKKNGYEPYFDPAKRAHVNPADYPAPQDMAREALPKQEKTIAKYRAMYDTPEARERLQAAFDAGQRVPGSQHWYAMKQLQDKYVQVLGEVDGKARFKTDFAEAMAATTGGADPTANYLMAHLANYFRDHGIDPFPASHQLPTPVGGQYAGTNMEMYEQTVGRPGFTGFDVKNPKRFDFAYSFLGNPTSATIDEQMSDIILPGMAKPHGDSYGVASQLVREMAERNGVDPQNFQDVAWAGHKQMTTEARGKKFTYEGPMINHVNDAIERTHRLTGMPRDEIVERGVVKHEIPLYAGAGVASAAALAEALGMQPRGEQ